MSGRTLLGVWAHPDDEAYLTAGLMAEFRQRGDRVVVVTATLGEHGTSDPQTWPPRRLAARRQTELRNSLAAVGVHESRLLGYEDGYCAVVDSGDGRDVIAEHIDDIEPDLIVTFGPDGMTGHPDHRAVSQWTTDAWITTGSTADLWYAHAHARLPPHVGHVERRDRPVGRPARSAVYRARRSRHDHEPARPRARPEDRPRFAAHASQTTPLIEHAGPARFREWWRTESFRAADVAAVAVR